MWRAGRFTREEQLAVNRLARGWPLVIGAVLELASELGRRHATVYRKVVEAHDAYELAARVPPRSSMIVDPDWPSYRARAQALGLG